MFTEVNKADLLDVLRRARHGLCRSDLGLPSNGPVHEGRDRILDAIDSLAEELTGERDVLLSHGFAALGGPRPAPRGSAAIRRALIMAVLAEELVTYPNTQEVPETMHGPIADRIVDALEGRVRARIGTMDGPK